MEMLKARLICLISYFSAISSEFGKDGCEFPKPRINNANTVGQRDLSLPEIPPQAAAANKIAAFINQALNLGNETAKN